MANKAHKTLHRSFKNRSWLGVCGGLGEYLDVDPVVIRLLWVLVTVFTGFFLGIFAYLVAALIMPEGQ